MPICAVCGQEYTETYWPAELDPPERFYNRCREHWHSGYLFVEMDLSGVDASEFQGAEIRSSSFGSQHRDNWAWPVGVRACIFRGCRFENCDPPPGSTLIECQVMHYKAQTDAMDWLLDHEGKPLKPLDENLFAANHWSTDPTKIPTEPRVIGVAEVV